MPNYKSKFEKKFASDLRKFHTPFKYESKAFAFVQPEKHRKYTPDFELPVLGVFVECKGKLTAEDRQKLIWAQEANPDLRLVLVFQRSRNPIRKGSKKTYGDWATSAGFKWFDWSTDSGKTQFSSWLKTQQKKEKESNETKNPD